MRITVVIVTWNRCELLRRTLDRLTKAAIPPSITFDCVVVNNNCTDATDAVIDEFRGRLPLRRLFEAKPGASNARNAALAAVTGEYALLIDDDVLVDQSWLIEFETAARAFPTAAALGGIIEPWFPHPPDPDLLEVFPVLKSGFCGLDHDRAPGPLPDDLFVWSANMAIRMDALGDLRFDPDWGPRPTSLMGGEEMDLLRRLRARGFVAWWPNMRVQHYVAPSRTTLKYLLRFTAAQAAQLVLVAPPVPPVATFLGAPRWLLRRCWSAYLRYWLSFVTSAEISPLPMSRQIAADASRRRRTLAWRRELAVLGGMVRGYRQLEGRQRGGSQDPVVTRAVETR